MALVVERNLFPQHSDEFGPFRARAHQTHVAAKNIYHLRNFIQTITAQDFAQTGDSSVAMSSPHRSALFSIVLHGAKLQNRKGVPMKPYALLTEQDWRSGFQDNCQSDQQQ